MTGSILRFWSFVEKSRRRCCCWLWGGSRRPNGYGVFWNQGRRVSAHRFSWELANGPIPDGLSVLHSCDNKPCVRPAHLFLGTQADNMRDRDQKGRNLIGSESPRAKLTESQVLEILASGRRYGWRIALARKFRVSISTIKAVACGQNWRHLQGAACR